MKKKLILMGYMFLVLIVMFSPIVVNELYKLNSGYMTLWEAEDTLMYVATAISSIATFTVSMIAVWQSEKANTISIRLLKIEEERSVPCLSIVEEETLFTEYCENGVCLKICLENIGNSIIELKSVSDLNIHIVGSDIYEKISFCSDGLKYPTILPGKKKQLTFSMVASEDGPSRLCQRENISCMRCRLNWVESFDMYFKKKGNNKVYIENIEFTGNGTFLISNNIELKTQKILSCSYKLECLEKTRDIGGIL